MSKFRRLEIAIALCLLCACASTDSTEVKSNPEVPEPITFGMLRVEKNGVIVTEGCAAQFVDSIGNKRVIQPKWEVLALHLPPGPARLDELMCGDLLIGINGGEFTVPTGGSNVYFGTLKLTWKTRFDSKHSATVAASPPAMVCMISSSRCVTRVVSEVSPTLVVELNDMVETAKAKLMSTYSDLQDREITKSLLGQKMKETPRQLTPVTHPSTE